MITREKRVTSGEEDGLSARETHRLEKMVAPLSTHPACGPLNDTGCQILERNQIVDLALLSLVSGGLAA